MDVNSLKIVEAINQKMDDSFFKCHENILKPFVCVCCDKFLLKKEVTFIQSTLLEKCVNLLSPSRELHPDIIRHYTYTGNGTSEIIQRCLLSPKAIFTVYRNQNSFVICNICKKALTSGKKAKVPPFAICNGFEIGKPPQCILDLSDIELAFITDVQCHSHLLTFKGGHKGIKGWHSMLKTGTEKKRQVLEGMDRLGSLPDKVIICLTGSFTEGQKQKILNKANIRRHKCKAAMDWLIEHNIQYRQKYPNGFDLENVNNPVILDLSKQSDTHSSNENIEMTEDICIVFPDNTLNEITAGYKSHDELKKVVSNLQNHESFSARVNIPESGFVRDFEKNNFSMSFIRQFPYGYGGLEEIRTLQNGSIGKFQKDTYIKHITNLSNLHFSEPLFLLVSFNIFLDKK